jgi:hypothetical protein
MWQDDRCARARQSGVSETSLRESLMQREALPGSLLEICVTDFISHPIRLAFARHLPHSKSAVADLLI